MLDVVQRPKESIRDFVGRFRREAVSAPDLTDDIRIMVFIKALLPDSGLAYELSRKNPASVEAMYAIAHVHMVAQELVAQRTKETFRAPEASRLEWRKDYQKHRTAEPLRGEEREAWMFTPLNTHRAHILAVLKKEVTSDG